MIANSRIEAQGFYRNLIWTNDYETKLDIFQGWIPFDTLGNQISKDAFNDFFFVEHKPLIVKWLYKKGVIDANFNWIIPLNYIKITELNIQNYLVLNGNRKYGLLNSKNEIIVDTIFKNVSQIYVSHNRVGKLEDWWLFENEKEKVLVENISLEKVTNLSKIDSLIELFALKRFYNESKTGFKLEYSMRDYEIVYKSDSILNQAPYRKQFISFMLNIFEQHKETLCFYDEPAHGYRVKVNYLLEACGTNFISIKINYNKERISQVRLGDRELSEEKYTMIWQNGALKVLHLKDIFKKENDLNKELKIALKIYEEYCNQEFTDQISPIDQYGGIDYLMEQVKSFRLDQKGLIISLGENNYYHSVIEVLIPAERLLKYKKSKWIVDYLN